MIEFRGERMESKMRHNNCNDPDTKFKPKHPDISGSPEALGYARTKIQLHTDLNKAFSVLLGICLELDIKIYHETLLRGRSFLSGYVDHLDIPSA